MPGEILTPRDMLEARREIRDSAAGMRQYSVGRPWRVRDPHDGFQWRVTARIGSIVRVERYREESDAITGHAQLVADLILLASRAR